jgi:hypothetical protein
MRSVLSLTLILAAVSCTSYQPTGATGGFSETRLSDTLFQVRFTGNGYTSDDRVTEFFLRRCAEIALENRYRFFRVTDERGTTPNFLNSSRVASGTLHLLAVASPEAADAVTVIRETDFRAGGRLSERAATQLQLFETSQHQ